MDDWSRISFVWRHIAKLNLSRLFKQNTEGSSITKNFQTGVRFSSWSRTLKLMALKKIIGQWFHWEDSSDYLGGICTCYQKLCSSAFNNVFNEMAEVFSWYFLFIFVTQWLQIQKLSFDLSINVISITLSFVVLDLCPVILFQKL